MRPTPASQVAIVIEANEIVYQAAKTVEREGTSGKFKNNLAKRAITFISSGIRFERKI